MRKNKMILLLMMLLPWLTVPFLGKLTIKRFYPGALFIVVWIAVESIIAKRRVWWRIYEKIIPNAIGEMPFMVGPFFVGSLWILKFTFGNFIRYLFLNLFLDTLFAYPGMFILKRLGIASFVRLRPFQMVILFMSKSVIMYGIQNSVDKLRKKPKSLLQKLFS
ncbi:hypothetical protein J7E79_08600 [Bacillus sp. ISL-40]|uniref:hypothetical protein n=1 Tax=unclassified Bacillus (in: firmicutes) TaxID=185979 RepID=UPI001BE993CE|nr:MULTISPECIES: hypothetical protein [unclassified Bacillus (in: firmicutes)]MBT2697471.1 hypothetical protein [Bacillus sp. ISL-40]MBT2720979.1 hypothetical protein [Bacillus sp. ISL-46]MBT2741713.1 hypothetical protein [Bacillus sp. ISL-77]